MLMKNINELKIKIFADGANLDEIEDMNSRSYISGLTTNPSLMRKAGVEDYVKFCKEILGVVREKPISFEVFADEFSEMERQARVIASWGENVYVKIPITNSRGISSLGLIKRLTSDGVKVNVTAMMTLEQVEGVIGNLNPQIPSNISIFAGRIADTGRDPVVTMQKTIDLIQLNPLCELIWASTRELFNIYQADSIGCHIITVTPDIINKFSVIGFSLEQYSLETVKMFHRDALSAGYKL